MDKDLIQKLLDANLDHLASRASNPRATLGALAEKIAGAIDDVEARMVETDMRAMELPALIDEGGEKLKKLDAIVEKAKNDGRPDLEQAAAARKQSQEAAIAALKDEEASLDAQRSDLEALLGKLQMKQVDVDGAIASAPSEPVGVRPPSEGLDLDALRPAAPAPALRTAATPAPKPAAGSKLGPPPGPAMPAPAAPAPKPAPAPAAAPAKPAAPPAKPAGGAAKGGDDLDDAFAALLAAENLSLDEIELPKKSAKRALPLPDSDDGIPDLVMVSDTELPDDATDEDRAPIPTVPAKGAAAPRPGQPKAAAPPAASGQKLASPPPPGGKVGAPSSGPAAPVGKPSSSASPEAPKKKSRAWVWVTGIVIVGGGGAAIAHFVYGLF